MTGTGVINNRILLIRPPTVMKGTSFIATQFPLNIAVIAAVLLKEGYDVRIMDLDVEPFREDVFMKELTDFSPFIVGISSYTPTIINAHALAVFIKKYLPDAVVVVGGTHVSALPRETLSEFGNFDIGVIGEGEDVMVKLASALRDGKSPLDMKGLVYRGGGSIKMTGRADPIADLDRLPLPARHILKIPLYKGQSHRGFSRSFRKITEIMTSRGCPNRCIFCASDVVTGRGVRFRSSDSVKEEIGECIERYGFNHFTISDDTFTLNEKRLYEICDEFARRKVTWNCNARTWPISEKMLSIMARSGCEGITFGVESGSERILRLIKKNVTLEQMENAFRWSRRAGIKLIEADIIIGSHPSETLEDIALTRKFLRTVSPDIVMVSIIVPYPGTEVYSIMAEKNLINDKKWDNFILFGREPSWKTENFTSKELLALQKKMLASFYFRPFYILKMLSKIKSAEELAYWLRGGMDFLRSCFRSKNENVTGL